MIKIFEGIREPSADRSRVVTMVMDILKTRGEGGGTTDELLLIDSGWTSEIGDAAQGFRRFVMFVERNGIIPIGAIEVKTSHYKIES